jgi:hypothetical protein
VPVKIDALPKRSSAIAMIPILLLFHEKGFFSGLRLSRCDEDLDLWLGITLSFQKVAFTSSDSQHYKPLFRGLNEGKIKDAQLKRIRKRALRLRPAQ